MDNEFIVRELLDEAGWAPQYGDFQLKKIANRKYARHSYVSDYIRVCDEIYLAHGLELLKFRGNSIYMYFGYDSEISRSLS